MQNLKKIIGSIKNRRGETIIETLIALSIIAVVVTLSSTAIINAMKGLRVSKERVIAVNLAREGIEAMRNIRDTNWLKFSEKRRVCWNNQPGLGCTDATNSGTSDNAIPAGKYIVYLNQSGDENQWKLRQTKSFNDLSANNNEKFSRLYIVDIDSTDGTDDKDMYNHLKNEAGTDIGNAWGTEVESTNFFRTIDISYLNDNGTEKTTGTPTKTDNRMRVKSTVMWKTGTGDHFVELYTHLTDYYGRTNLTD